MNSVILVSTSLIEIHFFIASRKIISSQYWIFYFSSVNHRLIHLFGNTLIRYKSWRGPTFTQDLIGKSVISPVWTIDHHKYPTRIRKICCEHPWTRLPTDGHMPSCTISMSTADQDLAPHSLSQIPQFLITEDVENVQVPVLGSGGTLFRRSASQTLTPSSIKDEIPLGTHNKQVFSGIILVPRNRRRHSWIG